MPIERGEDAFEGGSYISFGSSIRYDEDSIGEVDSSVILAIKLGYLVAVAKTHIRKIALTAAVLTGGIVGGYLTYSHFHNEGINNVPTATQSYTNNKSLVERVD